jgi:hypothetical protein
VVPNLFSGSGSSSTFASASNSATAFLGFNASGFSGWLQINFGGPGGTISYLDAAYEDSGGRIHVGSGSEANVPVPVPVPSTLGLIALGLLAAGAAGKRRTARRAASQA